MISVWNFHILFLCLPEASTSGCGEAWPAASCFQLPAVCRLLCSNVRGLGWKPQWDDHGVVSILLYSETLLSDIRHMSELLIFGFGRPVLLCRGWMPRAWRIWKFLAYVRNGYGKFCQPKFSVVVAKCWFIGVVIWDRTYICSVFTSTLT